MKLLRLASVATTYSSRSRRPHIDPPTLRAASSAWGSITSTRRRPARVRESMISTSSSAQSVLNAASAPAPSTPRSDPTVAGDSSRPNSRASSDVKARKSRVETMNRARSPRMA